MRRPLAAAVDQTQSLRLAALNVFSSQKRLIVVLEAEGQQTAPSQPFEFPRRFAKSGRQADRHSMAAIADIRDSQLLERELAKADLQKTRWTISGALQDFMSGSRLSDVRFTALIDDVKDGFEGKRWRI